MLRDSARYLIVVVLLLSAWLFYRRWGRLRRLPLESGPSWLTAALLVSASS